MYKETDMLYVKITKNGYIPQIGMCGPIPNPIKLSAARCLSLVKAGIPVFEVEPTTMRTIELTIANVFNDDKFVNVKVPEVKKVNKIMEAIAPEVKFSGVKVDAQVDPNTVTEDNETTVKEDTDTTEESKVDEQQNQNYSKKNKKKNNK